MNAAAATTTEASLRVPFVRLDNGDPELMGELLDTVADIASRSAFTLGEPVAEFERRFAAWCGTDFAVGVSSGTAALELALRALGIGPGDDVIVPTNSFIATAEAVSAVGATPVLADVDEDTSLLTAEIVEAALTPATRCVIPVHLFGRTVEMGPLAELCRDRGIYLVEDACQAHGSTYEGRRAGAIGDVGCFSFYPTKNLGAWGDGGALVTDDEEIAAQVALLRSHGEGSRHHHQMPARTDRLDALQAALLSVKLDRLDEANQGRREAAAALTEALAGTSVITPAAAGEGRDHVFHLYVVRSSDRDALRAHLDAEGVAAAIHYPTPIHLQPAYADLGQGPGSLPVAERLAGEILSLPIFPTISEAEIERTAEAVAAFGPS
ncbi:MAG TPA: DegT/DnrJ/EryC1/StrS family aminotransferase [Solirubrobacterales bacterium]|nr:DegT/DnrJ/EryC1/StrS family aminotransferase [Solirubrobacterales bacterium]